jgi:regulator of replication initiation timing
MKSNILNFKISSALKNLIGKELITDQYVAIFELVKNSFDAHASEVIITFESINDIKNAKIVIQDNGKGMNYEDLINKWLFVAYSAKKDGSEDSEYEVVKEQLDDDYRNKITPKRVFAGAKGVGRFSCDRLGTNLYLVTRKKEENSVIDNLIVDWKNFEEDSKTEFMNVPVRHSVLESNNYNLNSGTVLEITNLCDIWNRDALLKLKRSLEKLINPNEGNDEHKFSIKIICKDELKNDERYAFERDKVNGYIRNTIFDVLKLKTTQIISEISEDGKTITTSLTDRDKLIYKVKERNPFYTIKDIKIDIFILNRSAKINFKKLMGVDPVNYGSVFVYKNGFRVYPYGEIGEDIFDLEKRKTQGYYRYFGTREIIGRIQIHGNEENLKETTSRDGGLIKSRSYEELKMFFYDKAIKRLEKYVYDIIKWGDPLLDKETGKEIQKALEPEDVKNEILQVIANLSRVSDLISIEYDKNFFEIINEKQEKNANKILNNLSRSAEKINDSSLHKEVEKTKKYFQELLGTNKELKLEGEKTEKQLEKVKLELEHTTKHNLFLKTISSTDTKEVVALQHHIDRSAERINFHVDNLVNAINQNSSKEVLFSYIKKISLENEKILTVSRFVTKANFNMKATEIESDFIQFVNEYIENVYLEYDHLKINRQQLNIKLTNIPDINFNLRFRPLEIIMLIDNILSNSFKAKAKNVEIKWQSVDSRTIRLSFIDDGIGMTNENIEKIFDFGYTTTEGSGIGLFHVKDIAENKMNGKIMVNNKLHRGVEFIWEVTNEA